MLARGLVIRVYVSIPVEERAVGKWHEALDARVTDELMVIAACARVRTRGGAITAVSAKRGDSGQ